MVIRGPKHIAPDKLAQILAAGKEQLSAEDYAKLKSLLMDLQSYGLSAYLNSEIGKLMSVIEWELDIGDSPEWQEALIACDRQYLGRELKEMCVEAGLSPVGHKKILAARLYEASITEVMEIMDPYLEKAEEPEYVAQNEPIYRLPMREVKDKLEELHRTAPDEFYRRKRIIEKAIRERQQGKTRTLPEFNVDELQELLRTCNRLYR